MSAGLSNHASVWLGLGLAARDPVCLLTVRAGKLPALEVPCKPTVTCLPARGRKTATHTLAAAVPMPNANSIKVEGLVAPQTISNRADLTGRVDNTCVLGPSYSDVFSQKYGEFRSHGLRLVSWVLDP